MMRRAERVLSRLLSHGIIRDEGEASFYGNDDAIVTNRPIVSDNVRELFRRLDTGALMVLSPAAPWRDILRDLAEGADGILFRTGESLHRDIPVVPEFGPGPLAEALRRRPACVLRDGRIVARGTVGFDEAFIAASAVCFSASVTWLADVLDAAVRSKDALALSPARIDRYRSILSAVPPPGAQGPASLPMRTEEEIRAALADCGRKAVAAGLTHASFGNVSWCDGTTLYISRRGSFLDDLEDDIDPVPLDGSSTAALTASTELPAHRAIVERTGLAAVLHGHTRFAVVLSLCGAENECAGEQSVGDVPVVPGEPKGEEGGLAHTVPPKIVPGRGVIVRGHGTFVAGRSLPEAFAVLAETERLCFALYRERAGPILRPSGA
jgi:ribulose-5-phosphate 4-epimerase/fuculose-1-phosphate aldolase